MCNKIDLWALPARGAGSLSLLQSWPRNHHRTPGVAAMHSNRLSIMLHRRFWPCDHPQSLCSRAYLKHGVDWRWAATRVALDALFYFSERDHCKKSFMRYH